MITVGIDTGGTFTDFVVHDGERIRRHKQLSTPAQPEQAIIAGLKVLGLTLAHTHIVHGSTVATNTLLEGKGAATVFITNRGFADTLSIGRQARRELYNLTPLAQPVPVEREYCLETGGRLAADGSTIEALSEAQLDQLIGDVLALEPEAVAVSLLFSFLNPEFEQAIAARLPRSLFVSLSSEVLPEHREYERGIATWLNASTGPVMRGYLERLAAAVSPASLAVMQSSAVTCTPAFAAQRTVNLLLSGPAGGLLGACHVANRAEHTRIMTFDMGGTSTDVALIDGAIKLTTEGQIGTYPVSVPMVDMHTIGAGGGSIARFDAGGLLHVGPQSAGASPGPACYGAGGREATVTDANVVLGRVPPTTRLGGTMALDVAAAEAAIRRLSAATTELDVTALAAGIVEVANEHMRQALRVISVERGIDPRDFVLVSFGGAGGLHVCALAEGLGMRRAMVPADAGVLSALGMVVARPGRRQSRTVRRELAGLHDDELHQLLQEIAEPGVQALAAEGHVRADLSLSFSADVCYRGQSFALNLPYTNIAALSRAFHQEHEQRYGHRLHHALELVNLRVAVDLKTQSFTATQTTLAATAGTAEPDGGLYPVYARAGLALAQRIIGPAIVVDDVATTFIDRGWSGTIDAGGNLTLDLG